MGAEAGTLSIMVGGDREIFERILPLFEVMGSNIVHVGENGAGQVTKACNQIVITQTIAGVAEAWCMADAMGVDKRKVREALMGGFASSRIMELHGQKMIDEDYAPAWRARAGCAQRQGQHQLALGAARRAARLDPDDRALLRRVEGLLRRFAARPELRRHRAELTGELRKLESDFGPEYPRIVALKEQIGELDLQVDPDQNLPELRKADFLVMPSRSEGMPVTVLEAWSQRLGLIATTVGGVPEIVGDGGLYVAPDDVEGLLESGGTGLVAVNSLCGCSSGDSRRALSAHRPRSPGTPVLAGEQAAWCGGASRRPDARTRAATSRYCRRAAG